MGWATGSFGLGGVHEMRRKNERSELSIVKFIFLLKLSFSLDCKNENFNFSISQNKVLLQKKSMYSILRSIHSYWAFFVLIILAAAILNAFIGKSKGREFSAKDLRISLFGLIFSHIQLLIGLVLYFVSPWFDQWSALGMGVMKDAQARLYLVEHPLTNLIAIVLITMGWSMHKRQTLSSKKFLRIGLFYALGLPLLLSRIPWDYWI